MHGSQIVRGACLVGRDGEPRAYQGHASERTEAATDRKGAAREAHFVAAPACARVRLARSPRVRTCLERRRLKHMGRQRSYLKLCSPGKRNFVWRMVRCTCSTIRSIQCLQITKTMATAQTSNRASVGDPPPMPTSCVRRASASRTEQAPARVLFYQSTIWVATWVRTLKHAPARARALPLPLSCSHGMPVPVVWRRTLMVPACAQLSAARSAAPPSDSPPPPEPRGHAEAQRSAVCHHHGSRAAQAVGGGA